MDVIYTVTGSYGICITCVPLRGRPTCITVLRLRVYRVGLLFTFLVQRKWKRDKLTN